MSGANPLTTLTSFESVGIRSTFNLADGHAAQDLGAPFEPLVEALPSLWRSAVATPIPEANALFRDALASLMGSKGLARHRGFRICPTASNSIDLVAAWLKLRGYRCALLHPTFDNLALLLRRRGVPLVPVSESVTESDSLDAFLDRERVQALFLTNPNNPTGLHLSRAQFEAIVTACAKRGITLILDRTFRFFYPSDYDDYAILLEAGVPFILIEDTGKTWPTLDMKASLVAYAAQLAPELEALYEEVYLCVSPFVLTVLASFARVTREAGLSATVWRLVEERRRTLRDVIAGTGLRSPAKSLSSRLGVEWYDISATGHTDIELCDYLQGREVTILPGRYFFWADRKPPTCFVRFALMKPQAVLDRGLIRLGGALQDLAHGREELPWQRRMS